MKYFSILIFILMTVVGYSQSNPTHQLPGQGVPNVRPNPTVRPNVHGSFERIDVINKFILNKGLFYGKATVIDSSRWHQYTIPSTQAVWDFFKAGKSEIIDSVSNALTVGATFGATAYLDRTYEGTTSVVGSLLYRFPSTDSSGFTAAYTATTGGAAYQSIASKIEMSPGFHKVGSWGSVNRGLKQINLEGNLGTHLYFDVPYSYITPDIIPHAYNRTPGIKIKVDTFNMGVLTDSYTHNYGPVHHLIMIDCNTIYNEVNSFARSETFSLKAKQWRPAGGLYLISPFYCLPNINDTISQSNADIDVDLVRIDYTGEGDSVRGLVYLANQIDSCVLVTEVGNITKGREVQGLGKGFALHMFGYNTPDTVLINRSVIYGKVGTSLLNGITAADIGIIHMQPYNPGEGDKYPIYIVDSKLSYDFGALRLANRLLYCTDSTSFTRSSMSIKAGNIYSSDAPVIEFKGVNFDSTTIYIDGYFVSQTSPAVIFDNCTFTNGAKVVLRGRYETLAAGTPAISFLNTNTDDGVILDKAVLISNGFESISGTETVIATQVFANNDKAATITLTGGSLTLIPEL